MPFQLSRLGLRTVCPYTLFISCFCPPLHDEHFNDISLCSCHTGLLVPLFFSLLPVCRNLASILKTSFFLHASSADTRRCTCERVRAIQYSTSSRNEADAYFIASFALPAEGFRGRSPPHDLKAVLRPSLRCSFSLVRDYLFHLRLNFQNRGGTCDTESRPR